jgi:hypothetical protein
MRFSSAFDLDALVSPEDGLTFALLWRAKQLEVLVRQKHWPLRLVDAFIALDRWERLLDDAGELFADTRNPDDDFIQF